MIYSASKLAQINDAQMIKYFLQQKTTAIKDILIIKRGITKVKVIIDNPKNKLHGWGLKDVIVKQMVLDKNGNSGWMTEKIPFHGQLILTILDSFNQILCKQIRQNVKSMNEQFDLWCQLPIQKVVKLNKFEQASLGFEHAFFFIEDCMYPSKIKLIQSRCWSSSQFDSLLTIAQLQGLQIKNQKSIQQILLQQSLPINKGQFQKES